MCKRGSRGAVAARREVRCPVSAAASRRETILLVKRVDGSLSAVRQGAILITFVHQCIQAV
jgi:hypothetical protein